MNEQDFKNYCNALGSQDEAIQERLANNVSLIRPLHGTIGVCTEAGELLDAVKKAIAYGKEIDRTNVIEEVGDILHYLQYVAEAFNFTMEDARDANVAKLDRRYCRKFSDQKAITRDVMSERKAMEDSLA